MSKRLALSLASALATFSLAGVSSASAGTVIGDACVANQTMPNRTVFSATAPSSPLPAAAPTGGVITRWGVNVAPTASVISQVFSVVRIIAPGVMQTVAESPQVDLVSGANQFAARIPISAGDRLGLFGPAPGGTLLCEGSATPADKVAFVLGRAPLGSVIPFAEEQQRRLPVTATIEPDADGDGYGDESQDSCPQAASVQTACPLVKLDASATVGRKAVTVTVSTDNAAAVLVKGVARLGKGRKANLKAGPKTVLPGKLTAFRLPFSKALKQKLVAMPGNKKLTLKITASTTNVAGQLSSDKLKAKLKGQG